MSELEQEIHRLEKSGIDITCAEAGVCRDYNR